MTSSAIYELPIPRFLKLLGARWRDRPAKPSFRMSWGDLTFGSRGWALQLCLFHEHWSLNLHAFWVQVFITLPIRPREVAEGEIMESWGASYNPSAGGLHLRWGTRCKIWTVPWRNWQHMANDVLRRDGSWAPFVGSWERDKKPDGRAIEVHPYYYLLRNGERQKRIATVHVERRIWRLRWLRWTSLFQKVRHYIEVEFNEEVGEETGSWKGGVLGCGYDLKPGETPLQCLQRMQSERRF